MKVALDRRQSDVDDGPVENVQREPERRRHERPPGAGASMHPEAGGPRRLPRGHPGERPGTLGAGAWRAGGWGGGSGGRGAAGRAGRRTVLSASRSTAGGPESGAAIGGSNRTVIRDSPSVSSASESSHTGLVIRRPPT